MSRIASLFKSKPKLFIPFITAGDNNLKTTLSLMHTLAKNGADIIEIGMPFSDPMADGPIIARAHERALAQGVNLQAVLDLIKTFSQTNTQTANVLMGYLNPIEIFGYQAFACQAELSGVDGLLIVDMPPEEAHDLKRHLDAVQLDLIFLIAPTTSNSRLKLLANIASGFVYFVSLKGVTGAGHLDLGVVSKNLSRIRTYLDLPIGVGFGIKNAQTAQAVCIQAEAVIVGSALVSLIEHHHSNQKKLHQAIGDLSNEISSAIQP
jgi:tryptophan synthase alpha chain